MNLWQNYITPTHLADALRALQEAPAPAVPIAGGTDLLLDLEQGRHAGVTTLVDLTSVAEMRALETRGSDLFIGAAMPLSAVAESPLVGSNAQALQEACRLIGGPQVRNVATLGGNVAHALPAADGTIALIALGAEAEVASIHGVRRLPIEELFQGPGKSALVPGRDLIAGFLLPLIAPGEASAFKRVMRPQGVALPIINMAVWIRRRGDLIGGVRLVVGPSGPRPHRCPEAEDALVGKSLTEGILQEASDILLQHAAFRTSPRRASADYRRGLVETLLRETVSRAWERAKT